MKIIKTKFLCKNTSQTVTKGHPKYVKDRFIEGKWYDGEYEAWNFDDGYRLNGGWRRYWVINEKGEKEEIHRAHMNAIFETDIEKLRDNKINEILKK